MKSEPEGFLKRACPAPKDGDRITMAHGAGGLAAQRLIRNIFHTRLGDGSEAHDGARLEIPGGKAAFTTDSFVIRPLFFPGGDIGSLAVHGTVNDLAMCGAEPRWLSAGFILEEGFKISTLSRIVDSMAAAAQECGVRVVTGDTKVVERGNADGLYINTAGIGVMRAPSPILPSSIRAGDVLLVSGDVGAPATAVLSVREGLEFKTQLKSDSGPLWKKVDALIAAGVRIRCLRDLTRGGLATALCEIAEDGRLGLHIIEEDIPVNEAVSGACEILGMDPLYAACEGRMLACVPAGDAGRALEVLGATAARIGTVVSEYLGEVRIESCLGVDRLLARLNGEQLPRIC